MAKIEIDLDAINALTAKMEPKLGRDARKFAVDSWLIHTGQDAKPQGWKDPYAEKKSK